MNNKLITILAAAALLLLSSCKDFVQNIEPPIDSVADSLLNTEDQVPFLMSGVQARFNNTLDGLTVLSDDLSDAFVFDENVPGATFLTLKEIDDGRIPLTNSDAETYIERLGQLRLLADTLVERVGHITFTDSSLRQRALFTGYLYGGIARYWWASYFGLAPTEGGGVIANGPFIPSDKMYGDVINCLTLALANAGSDYDRRLVNTLMAKTYLIEGQYATAEPLAEQGLRQDDPPLAGLYLDAVANDWWLDAGAGRTQIVADARFAAYIEADPTEAGRIVLAPIDGLDGVYRQDMYPLATSPMPFVTWQENSLMLAELRLRADDAPEALIFVNDVRASHGVTPLADVTLDSLYIERDKELFATGNRLIDERRFGRWHLAADTWQYLPITQRERDVNPNLH